MKNVKILAVIPARGGSKGIKNKNIVNIGGSPLIQYTIDAALKSKMLSDCIVSTDSDEITKVAKLCGAIVPFKRPELLSNDQALSLPVIQHAVDFMEDYNEINLSKKFKQLPKEVQQNEELIQAMRHHHYFGYD